MEKIEKKKLWSSSHILFVTEQQKKCPTDKCIIFYVTFGEEKKQEAREEQAGHVWELLYIYTKWLCARHVTATCKYFTCSIMVLINLSRLNFAGNHFIWVFDILDFLVLHVFFGLQKKSLFVIFLPFGKSDQTLDHFCFHRQSEKEHCLPMSDHNKS